MSDYVGPPPEDDAETRTETGWPSAARPRSQDEKEPPNSGAANETAVSPSSRGIRRRLRLRLATLVLCVLLTILIGVAGWGLYAMHVNEQRAVSWQHRAQKLQANAAQLQSLLDARTRLLNQRIDQMDRLARKLKLAQVALGQSQGDVSSLEKRQRQLANEKAQLQDQQRLLDKVAGGYVTCKQDLIQLLSDFANSYDTTSSYDTANTDCTNADASLQSYLGAYPNG